MSAEDHAQPHQKVVVDLVRKHKRLINGDRMGLGKSLAALIPTLTDKNNDNILIGCGKSALSVWPKEIQKWYPEHAHRLIPVVGQKYSRVNIWNRAAEGKIYLASLSTVREDIDIMPSPWDGIILDEAHKFRNRKSQMFQAVNRLKCNNTYLDLSGSLVSRGDHELFTFLQHLWPRQYTSYWKFIGQYFMVDTEFWGNRKILGVHPHKEAAFAKMLMERIVRRTHIEGEEPIKRLTLDVQINDRQLQVYLQLAKDLVAEVSEGVYHLAPTVMTKVLRLRQLLACPKILGVNDYGAGIDAILDHFDDHELTHTVIFCPFTSAFPFLKERIKQYIGIDVDILQGGLQMGEVNERIRNWQLRERGIMLVSIKFAESYDLSFTKVGYCLGHEYDPNVNNQAIYRLQRSAADPTPATIYFVSHGPEYADADVTKIVDEKEMKSHITNVVLPGLYKLMAQNNA